MFTASALLQTTIGPPGFLQGPPRTLLVPLFPHLPLSPSSTQEPRVLKNVSHNVALLSSGPLMQGCPNFWGLWAVLEGEELSWATH